MKVTYLKTYHSGVRVASAAIILFVSFLAGPLRAQLPTGWVAQDIGAVGAAGSTTYNSGTGTFTVNGSGADIYGTADEFHFCHQAFTGDFELVARMTSTSAATAMKCGLMVRAGTAANAPHNLIMVRPSDSILQTIRRTAAGGSSSHQDYGTRSLPIWFKITRHNGTVSTWSSVDGESWSAPKYWAGYFTGTVNAGMFVCSGQDGTLRNAQFDNVYVGALRLEVETGWLGNTWPGGGITTPQAQHYVLAMHVDPANGDIFLNGEGEYYSSSSYTTNGAFRFHTNGTHFKHGYAITADATYFYQGREKGFVRYPRANGTGSSIYLSNQLLKGMAVNGTNLYLSDATANLVRVWSTSSMSETSSFALARPGAMAVDPANGNLWIVQEKDATNPAKVLLYQPNGTKLTTEITDVLDPRGITVSANKVYVADSGTHQQIRIFNTSNGLLNSTFGASGGIYSTHAGTKPGEVHPLKFNHPVAVGVDSGGNIFVACNGPKGWWGTIGDGTGMELRKFTSGGTLLWERLATEYVDCADAVPGTDGVDLYTKEARYQINYSQPPGQQWTYKAMTLDPFAYPGDPRITTPKPGGSYVRLINGQKFLFVTDMVGEYLNVFRFAANSEIAIPCVQFYRGVDSNQVYWIWRDLNGNGQIDANEKTTSTYDRELYGWWVDTNGDVWTASKWNGAKRFPSGGLDGNGIPNYSFSTATPYSNPSEVGGYGSGGELGRAHYVAASDTMLLGAYTITNPKPSNETAWAMVGREILRYDNWTGARTLRYRITLPYVTNTAGTHESYSIKSFCAAGDYIFAIRSADARVYVYSLADGSLVTDFVPGPEVGGHCGLIDIPVGLNAMKRANGDYVIMVEDDDQGKVLLMRWNPNPSGSSETHRWRFENNGADSIGSLTASLVGGAGYSTDVSEGVASLLLNGTNANASTTTKNLGNTFSLEAWVRLDAGSSNIRTIIANATSGSTANGFKLCVNTYNTSDGKIYLETGNGSAGASASTATNVFQYDVWNHVGVSVDRAAGIARIYYNGVDVTSTQTIRTDFNVNAGLYIGCFSNGSYRWKGKIDDLRVHNQIVSFAQGIAIYDDFQVPATSDTRWTKQLAGAGAITFTGTAARIDMSSATANKKAALLANGLVVRLNAANETQTLTWDMQVELYGAYGWQNGLCIGNNIVRAGIHGNHSSLGTKAKKFYVGSVYGIVDGGTARQHYQLSITMNNASTGAVTLLLKVYQHNAAYDADPTQYPVTGVLLEQLTTTATLAAATDHAVRFFAQEPLNNDTYAQARDRILIDNTGSD